MATTSAIQFLSFIWINDYSSPLPITPKTKRNGYLTNLPHSPSFANVTSNGTAAATPPYSYLQPHQPVEKY